MEFVNDWGVYLRPGNVDKDFSWQPPLESVLNLPHLPESESWALMV